MASSVSITGSSNQRSPAGVAASASSAAPSEPSRPGSPNLHALK